MVFFLLGCVSFAWADTIVLKNGRRIVAVSATEEGGKVSFETSSGHMSLPLSIVAHIERDNQGSLPSSGLSMNAADVPASAPGLVPSATASEAEAAAVHNGAVDTAYLSRLDAEARRGARAAVEKTVAAHYAAGQFLLSKGDWSHAADQYHRALAFDPNSVPLLLNLAVLDLKQSQFAEALEPLERARSLARNSPDVAKLMGWAFYGSNRLDQAVEEWKRAEELRPDPEVERALEKAERDRAEERDYREGETAHFDLKYYGGAAPDLARGILRTLEGHYRDISGQLDFEPRSPVVVILYTREAFQDITRAPAWAGAVYDGRIRVPVQGLSAVTPDLSRVMRHELVHSFITQKTHGRCPTWLQEGIAQWFEGRRSREEAGGLINVYAHNAGPSLADLEGSWMALPGDAAGLAYAWSLAAVEAIIHQGGMSDVTRLLDQIAATGSTEAALREVLHSSYSDLDEETVAFLRREYLH